MDNARRMDRGRKRTLSAEGQMLRRYDDDHPAGDGKGLTGKVLLNAKKNGAECIITACPLCQINLEAYQKAISKSMGEDCSIPVLYFTQLMGTALGLGSARTGSQGLFHSG